MLTVHVDVRGEPFMIMPAGIRNVLRRRETYIYTKEYNNRAKYKQPATTIMHIE